jgi:hypothetical protein
MFLFILNSIFKTSNIIPAVLTFKHRIIWCQILFFLILLLAINNKNIAREKKKVFRDTTDKAIDVGNWLMQKEGFLPVPTLITEPSLGYGIGGAVVIFHSSFLKRKGPPNMSGVLGGYTQNGTWAAGIFHRGYWKGDHLRYTGLLIKSFVNIDFYGSGNFDYFENPVQMNMDAWILFQQLYGRLGNSNFFVGGRYIYFPSKNSFNIPIDIPEFSGIEFEEDVSEISLLLNYDSRNSVFTPTQGIYFEVSGTYSDTWLGGPDQYGRLGITLLGFSELDKKFVMGIRMDQKYSLGNVPFYLRPFVNMRGVPIMKYQNKIIHTLELELNYNICKRWYLLGFTGMGNAFSDFSAISDGKPVSSIGAGFRYKIARMFGLHMGMDFAWSKDEFAFYIVFGHAWMK